MAKQMKQDTPLVPRKRRLAALVQPPGAAERNVIRSPLCPPAVPPHPWRQGLKHYA